MQPRSRVELKRDLGVHRNSAAKHIIAFGIICFVLIILQAAVLHIEIIAVAHRAFLRRNRIRHRVFKQKMRAFHARFHSRAQKRIIPKKFRKRVVRIFVCVHIDDFAERAAAKANRRRNKNLRTNRKCQKTKHDKNAVSLFYHHFSPIIP